MFFFKFLFSLFILLKDDKIQKIAKMSKDEKNNLVKNIMKNKSKSKSKTK